MAAALGYGKKVTKFDVQTTLIKLLYFLFHHHTLIPMTQHP